MAINEDWYPTTQAGEREMYAAIAANLDDVDVDLQMDAAKKTRLLAMANLFIAFYDNMLLNRAAVKGMNTDFHTIMTGNPSVDPMPTAADFQPLVMPAGNFVGMVAELRDIRRYMTGLFTWKASMGDVLKLNGIEGETDNPDTMSPSLKITQVAGSAVHTSARKNGMDGIEYQYRTTDSDVWQPLVSSGEADTILEIPVPAGEAQKIEIRAIYLKKFKRVGVWSPIYTVAVGG